MRFLTLLLMLTLSNSSFSQDTVKYFYPTGQLRSWQIKIDSNFIFKKSFYEGGQVEGEAYAYLTKDKPLIKSMKTYFVTGELKDVRNDTFEIRYEPDGSVFQTSQYKNFKKNGISRTYLAKRLWLDMEFVNGIQNGWTTTYDTSGKFITMKEFYHDGKQKGPTKYYNKNGILTKTIYYKDKCPYKAEYFDSKGKLINTITDKKAIWLKEGKPLGCS